MQDYIPREIDINEKIATVVVKQYDNLSRYIHLQIYDSDLDENNRKTPLNLVGCEARLYMELLSEIGYIDGEIADGENGIVTFLLPNGVTQKEGNYQAEVWITNADETSVISTKPFVICVSEAVRDARKIEATGQFSALDNALLRVAIDKARLDNLTALASSANVQSGTVDSEVTDIRTGYDGTTYTTAGNAVRGQIQQMKDSVATMAEFFSVVDGDYDENEEAAALVSDLKDVLERAESFRYQIDGLARQFEKVVEFIPDGGITGGKLCNEAVSVEKLSPALQRPSVTIRAGSVAEMIKIAESYFNYAYTADGAESGILYESHTGLYSDSLGENAAGKRYGIVCSSFAEAVINGISFQNSRYNGNGSNARFGWGVAFDDTVPFGSTENPTSVEIDNKYLTSQALAKYAAAHGFLYAIDGSRNVRAGDLLFSGDRGDRYLGIDHVALVINTDENYCTVLEAWPAKKTDIDGTEHDVGLRINYRVPITGYTYGAAFPVGDVENAPVVVESLYDIAGDTNSTTLIHEFKHKAQQGFYTVVCHGTFSGGPYLSVKYDGSNSNDFQSVMHRVGDDYYLTVYVQKPGVISLRMVNDRTYDISEVSLYRGYAEISAESLHAVRLNAGDNLNLCLEGEWYCTDAQTAKAVTHAPLGEPAGGFRLEAVRMTGGRRYRQTVWYVGAPDKMYVRMYTESGWSKWFVYGGAEV